MKLFLYALLASAVGTACGLGLMLLSAFASDGSGGVGYLDIISFGPLMFVPSLIFCGLLYTPVLFWLRRRLSGCEPAGYFPLVSGFLLNIPVALLLISAVLRGGFFSGFGEIYLFIAAFISVGLIYGIGFVRYCAGRG